MSSAGGYLRPGKLWSLWDMLEHYGFAVVALVSQLKRVEDELREDIAANPEAIWPHTILDNPLSLALNIASSLADKLELESTKREADRIAIKCKFHGTKSDILSRVIELQVRFQEDLRTKRFLFVPKERAALWGQDQAFGERVHKKFKAATYDIRNAGNSLALDQPTACVFHLSRAMEVAVRKLGKRLSVTISPQSTWRQITGAMDGKIRAMPEKTHAQKRKKSAWESAHTNLHHLGSVWRNKTMHPASSYTPSQARDVFDGARVAMTGLCDL